MLSQHHRAPFGAHEPLLELMPREALPAEIAELP